MKILASICLLILSPLASADGDREMVIVVSEPGNAGYEAEFRRQADAWESIARKGGMEVRTLGVAEMPEGGDRPLLEETLRELPKTGGELWLVWIGHGSFDGRTANFNLRGRDIDVEAVGALLESFERPLVLLHLFSASAPFLSGLSAENRIIVGANRSSGEKNYTRFGEKFADSLSAADADLDLDGSLSLLEAVLHASAATRAFYDDAQRVVQEHAVIDDNGDGRGTPAGSFKGLRAEGDAPDGAAAREVFFHQQAADPLPEEKRGQRAALEAEIDALRAAKASIPEQEYYDRLEALMLKMAGLYGIVGDPEEG